MLRRKIKWITSRLTAATFNNGTVTLTTASGGQAGSYTLKNKIDMTESFVLKGKSI